MFESFDFPDILKKLDLQALELCDSEFKQIEKVGQANNARVLKAFIGNKVSEAHLAGSTGYGYGDIGREVTDRVFAEVFSAEDALVRHTFMSGTHALSISLFGVLRPGDTLLSVTGKPYDTLDEVIGISHQKSGSLADFGIIYRQVELTSSGEPDYEAIEIAATNAKMIYIQRSRGYSLRPSLTVETIGKIIKVVKRANPSAIVMVDNCYGEFVEEKEPTAVGADLIAGSLIKNPGGGLAQTGGYIAGKRELVELCADRLSCIGMGKEVGCTLGQTRPILMGLFYAPEVVASALKTAVYAACLFRLLGYETYPDIGEKRSDIITAVKLGNRERLCAFCKGIQQAAPVDSFVTPEPWDMPGYDSQVIMAAGAFTMGSSIELSADAPLREPFAVWLQGGLNFTVGRIGILTAAQNLMGLSETQL